jgi:hypothetical protein
MESLDSGNAVIGAESEPVDVQSDRCTERQGLYVAEFRADRLRDKLDE